MPEHTFLPYEYAESALDLRPESITVDGTRIESSEVVDIEACSVSLAGRKPWGRAVIGLRATDPNSEVSRVLLEGETVGDAVSVVAVARNAEARWRQAARLRADQGGWVGQIEIDREQTRGSVVIEAFAIRSGDGRPDSQRAHRVGERVAGSVAWTVLIDERSAMPGGAIDGQWRDFRSDQLEPLRRRADCTWYLDLMDVDRPKLYLNEAVEGLKRALVVPQRIGRAARVRDALEHSVLQPVIMTMATAAIEDSKDKGFEEMAGWKRALLLGLGRFCDTSTEEQQVEQWLKAWGEGRRASVVADLATAVQRHLGVSDGARYLISELEQRENV